jgi:Domain of unknown function (DUF4214)/PEP-CTERM motif
MCKELQLLSSGPGSNWRLFSRSLRGPRDAPYAAGVVSAKRPQSRRRLHNGNGRSRAEGESKMKRIAALLTLGAAVCLSTSPTVRADITSENTNFINMAYLDMLQRPADPADVAAGLSALGSETRYQFALALDTSTEYYQLLVRSYFQDFLGRAPSPSDLSLYTGFLVSKNTDEFVQAQLASSAEFFLDSGSSNAGFVTALYKDFFNRTPTSGEIAFWVGALSTMSREQVASLLLGMQEYDTDLVKSYYLEFLRRPADSTGLNFFSTALNEGKLTDEQVIASLIGSEEYFNLAQPPAPTPEPATGVLLCLGIAGLALLRKQLAC